MPPRTRSSSIINGLPFRRDGRGMASSAIGVVGWGGAEYQYPLARRWRLRSGFNVTTGSIRADGSTRRFCQATWGRAGCSAGIPK